MLDAMRPAFGKTTAAIPRRLIAICTTSASIESIIAKTKPGKPGLRSLVQEVVASGLFKAK